MACPELLRQNERQEMPAIGIGTLAAARLYRNEFRLGHQGRRSRLSLIGQNGCATDIPRLARMAAACLFYFFYDLFSRKCSPAKAHSGLGFLFAGCCRSCDHLPGLSRLISYANDPPFL
ncbi:MAG: hypothetical protein VB067_04940 [Christensenellaceae bacterium]|nr:hypothetical protein [Eubacteriales bacterium]MEA5068313.1 hypothetical protein [Christensenellaceae bacterium]